MKRAPKEVVQDRITQAVVDTAAAKGIGATSMVLVAKAAKVSAGTLYLHFESKDDMLQKSFLRLKTELHARLMEQANAAPTAKDAIRAVWVEMIRFQAERPSGFLFLEYAGAAQVLTPEQVAQVAPLQLEVNAVVQRAIDDGTITVADLQVALNILIGPALYLARKHTMAGTAVPADEIENTFSRLWQSLGGS